MIALMLILIWVLVNYYKADPYTAMPSNINVQTPVEIKDNASNDGNEAEVNVDENIQNNEQENEPIDVPGASAIDEGNKEDQKQEVKPTIKPNETVVITSSEKTSNTEKQEVLNEIDKALMDLLQVVDKVQTVDETRLGIDESEVRE